MQQPAMSRRGLLKFLSFASGTFFLKKVFAQTTPSMFFRQVGSESGAIASGPISGGPIGGPAL